jgi:uncharacterized protein
MSALALLALGLPVGFLIGLIGIGGVLLAPTLVHVFGRDIHQAVSLSLASFVLAGLVAAARSRKADTRFAGNDWLFLGMIVPGAIAGALVTPWIPAADLSLVISVCVVFAGISCLRGRPSAESGKPFHPAVLIVMGLLTGLLSVISGSGGPLVCLPMLLWSGMEVRRALILAQVAQLPVAVTATLANGFAGSLDLVTAGWLSVAIVVGMLVGLDASRRIDASLLRKGVAWCLVIVGLALCLGDLQRLAS